MYVDLQTVEKVAALGLSGSGTEKPASEIGHVVDWVGKSNGMNIAAVGPIIPFIPNLGACTMINRPLSGYQPRVEQC